MEEKEHSPEHRGCLLSGEKIKKVEEARLLSRSVTDYERSLGVESLGVALVCSRPFGAPLTVTAPPNRCPRTVPSSTGRGSREPGPG